ncbi:hypothetical protein IWQ61_005448 [Dispira simplex]|nr:hypothetical protein IWQ61_005448 [Dispira simplex]
MRLGQFFGPHHSTQLLAGTPAQHDQPSLYFQFPYRSQSPTERGQCNSGDTSPSRVTLTAPTTNSPIYLVLDATELRRLAQNLFVPTGHAALVPVVPRWYTASQPQLQQNTIPLLAQHMALPGASAIHRRDLAQLTGPTRSSVDVTNPTQEVGPFPAATVRLLEVQLQFEEPSSSVMEDLSGVPVVASSHCTSRASYSSSPSPTLPPHDNLEVVTSGLSSCSCCGLSTPVGCPCGNATCLVPTDYNQCFHFRETIRLRRQIDSLRRCVALLQEDLAVECQSKHHQISRHNQVVAKLDAEIEDLHNQINNLEPAVTPSFSSLDTPFNGDPVGVSEEGQEESKEPTSLEQAIPPSFHRFGSVLLKNPLCFDPFEGLEDLDKQPWGSDEDDDDDSDKDEDEDEDSGEDDDSEDDAEILYCAIVMDVESDGVTSIPNTVSHQDPDRVESEPGLRSATVQFSDTVEYLPETKGMSGETDASESENPSDPRNCEDITMHQLLAEQLSGMQGGKDGIKMQYSDDDIEVGNNDRVPLDLVFSENDQRFSLPMTERLDILQRILRSHLAQARTVRLQPAMIIAHTDLLVHKFGLSPAQALDLILNLLLHAIELTLEQQLSIVGSGDDSLTTPLDRLEVCVQRILADFETLWLPLVEYYMVDDRLDQNVLINSLAGYLAHRPEGEKASSSTVTLADLPVTLSRQFLVHILTVLCLYRFSLLDSDMLYEGQSVFLSSLTTNDNSSLSLLPRTSCCSSAQWVWQAFVQYLVSQPFFSRLPKKDLKEGSSVPLAPGDSDSNDLQLRYPCSAAAVSSRFMNFFQGLSHISGPMGEIPCPHDLFT